MKLIVRLIVTLFALTGSFTMARAEVVCTGKNLLPLLQKEMPEVAKRVQEKSAEILNGKGVLWKVEKDGFEPSYLFGTIHLSDPRLLALKPAAQKALDGSNTVALEITEILSPEVMASKALTVMQYTMYTDDTSLDSKIPKQDLQAIKDKAADALGLPWNVAGKMKPWALMGTLILPACELDRKRRNKPFLDIKLGETAQKDGKTLVGLETLESQMEAISSIPDSFAINSLVQSVRLGEKMDDLFETMIQLYLEEDIGTLWALMLHMDENGFVEKQTSQAASDYAEFQRILVDKRNLGMADNAEKLFEKGAAFVAVGALHLPGEKGIVNILAQRGYKLTRIAQ